MNLIIPMAGRGSRLRPHTLTIPKPMVPVAGKPIVERLVEDLTTANKEAFEKIAFVIGDFGIETEQELLAIAESAGAEGFIMYQDKPLGTAHAISCAKNLLTGPVIIAFGDTLFKASMDFDQNLDGIIWAKRVEDPSSYGVLELNKEGVIENFIEKPTEFVSDLAIAGIYYIRDGEQLNQEIDYLISNNITEKGEFQLTNALENMKQKGRAFYPGIIDEWLDLGNKEKFVFSNQRILEIKKDTEALVSEAAIIENSIIIPPCYIGAKARIKNSIIGPHVSVGKDTTITNSVIKNCVIQNESNINNALLEESMIGNTAVYEGRMENISIGDFSHVS